jgi:hypothetical protein
MKGLKAVAVILILILSCIPPFVFIPLVFATESTVTTTTDNAFAVTRQRIGFGAGSRSYVFYCPVGTGIVSVRNSTDGLTWSGATTISSTRGYAGEDLGVWYDGTYFQYVTSGSNGIGLSWREGSLDSNGNITWRAAEQINMPPVIAEDIINRPATCKDSTGHSWIIGEVYWLNGTYRAFATKNANTDGTWSTESGFPYTLKTDTYISDVQIVPLTNGYVYCLYKALSNITLYGRLYNGTWQAEETIQGQLGYSAVAIGNDVHLVYQVSTTTRPVNYTKRTYGVGWSTPETVSATYSGPPALCKSSDTEIRAFWVNGTNIYFANWTSGSWSSPLNWTSISSYPIKSTSMLNVWYDSYSDKIGLTYLSSVDSYTIRFHLLDIPAGVVTSSVTLNSPSDSSTVTNTSIIDFGYTPTFYETIQNASLWTNVTGTWALTRGNSSAIVNNTQNTITYTFADDGVYLWNVGVFNSTTDIFASANRTLTIQTFQYYVDAQTDVDSVADVGTHSSFAAQKATDWTNDTLTEVNTNVTVVNNSENFVDNNSSNVDGHTGHGTSSNFTAQQDANILYNDTLTEALTSGGTSAVFTDGFEDGTFGKWDGNGATSWTNDGGICTNSSNLEGWASTSHSGTYYAGTGATGDGNLVSDNIDLSGVTQFGVQFWYAVDDTDDAGELVLKYWDGAAYDTIADLSGGAEDTWTYYSSIVTDSQYFHSTFRIDFLAACGSNEAVYVDDVVINKTLANNYELDYEFSWTTASFSEANEYLCIRTNSFAGTAENLGVDIWTGNPAGWASISVALTASQWNNISISTYLNQSTMYFRFIGKTESSDPNQNTWVIECTLIHTWSVGFNFELDLEEQFTSANFSRTNVELCVRMGAYNNSETIRCDYWNASSSLWITAIASLTSNVWNNVSVKAYTSNASVTFTVRFVGGTESGDTACDTWSKDACLLHTWDVVGGEANLAPSIPDLRLSLTSDTVNITTIDVYTWLDWEVNVTDSGTLNDIANVTIRIKDNPSNSIISASPAYNRTGEYWFNYANSTDTWTWYDSASWTSTSDWLDTANCAYPTKTGSYGWYLFRVKLAKSAVKSTQWAFQACAYDSGDNVTSKNFTGITVNSYSSLTILNGNSTHTWINATAGTNDNLLDQGAVYFNVTANYLFKIQAMGSGNLVKGTDYIGLGNVTIHKDTLVSSVSLTTSYADVGGLTSHALGEDVTLSVKLWLDVPADQPTGDYAYTLTLQVTSQS